jgi:hypothetical protein
VCGTIFPRFSTEQDCCSRSFTGGCYEFPATCFQPDYVAGTCVEKASELTCKRGGLSWRVPAGGRVPLAAGQAGCCQAPHAGPPTDCRACSAPPRPAGWGVYAAKDECCKTEFKTDSC